MKERSNTSRSLCSFLLTKYIYNAQGLSNDMIEAHDLPIKIMSNWLKVPDLLFPGINKEYEDIVSFSTNLFYSYKVQEKD